MTCADQQAGVQHRHLDRAALQRRDGLQVAAERAAGEQLDLDLAAALLLDQLGELLRALRPAGVLRVLERELEVRSLISACASRAQQRGAGSDRGER